MEIFRAAERPRSSGGGGNPYLELARAESMSVGLYELPAGATDHQAPHNEDEAYYVASGRAMFTGAGRTGPVAKGSLIFVPAHEEHRFHDIAQDLSVVVFFAPAETEIA